MAAVPLTRRDALRGLASVLVGAAASCERGPAPPDAVVPLANLEDGERVRITLRERPVEVVREGDVITARYLVCTHMGCLVTWDEPRERYACACHEGLFSRSGRPIGGPVTEPLVDVPFEIAAGHVVFRL